MFLSEIEEAIKANGGTVYAVFAKELSSMTKDLDGIVLWSDAAGTWITHRIGKSGTDVVMLVWGHYFEPVARPGGITDHVHEARLDFHKRVQDLLVKGV